MKQPSKYETIWAEIKRIYAENQRKYGYRRICIELKNRGIQINHKKVLRLMRELGLRAIKNKKSINHIKEKLGI